MNLINYSKFYDSQSLKESILEVMNKLLNYDETYQRVVFSLLMDEVSKKIEIKKLSYEYSIKAGYWKLKYGPVPTINLSPEYLGSYYITIFKYFDTNSYHLEVISVKDLKCRKLFLK